MLLEGQGVLLDYVNDTEAARFIPYASVTAPQLVRVEVWVDGERVDAVYAGNGGSHSWWASSGGCLVPSGSLLRGQRLRVIADHPCAFRLDWS